jgi:hypothetical protein
MSKDYDLSSVAQQASDHIWDSLQEAAMRSSGPAKKSEVIQFVTEGVELVLKAMQLQEPELKSVKADDHLFIDVEDQDGKMTKVAIHMESKSHFGQLVMCVFGYGEKPPKEQLN